MMLQHLMSKCFSTIDYDDDSVSFIHSFTSSTSDCTLSDDNISIGNAFSLTHNAADLDKIEINYHGPKVIPWHETPVTICMANTIGAVRSRRLFRVLFDSGSNVCMIKKSALLHNLILKELSATQDVKTLAGRLTACQVVTLRDIRLPDFDKYRQISQQKALVLDHDDCKYDIIFGTNFLSKVRIKLNYDTGLMEWYDVTLPLHPQQGIDSKEFDAMEDMYNIQLEDELFDKDWLQCHP